MSDSFRDLEWSDSALRKDAVLMAAISGLEYLEHPTRQDLVRFSRLFLPLFETACLQTRRTASATLSRLLRVPDDVAEMLINQPVEIATPFIAQYAGLSESALCRAVKKMGAPHARAAARRGDLSPRAIATLRSLGDPSVEGLLVLRGLAPDPAKQAAGQTAKQQQLVSPRIADAERRTVETPPLDPNEKLREDLRALALRTKDVNPARDSAVEAGAEVPLNRPSGSRKKATGLTADKASDTARRVAAAATRRLAQARLGQLARYANADDEVWFSTALADAMEISYTLARRIMTDLSGRQLAIALIGLEAPEETTKSALESFFPHLAEPSTRQTQANDLIAELDPESCRERLSAWQRAGRSPLDGEHHVPALAESKPARRENDPHRATQNFAQAMPPRKTA